MYTAEAVIKNSQDFGPKGFEKKSQPSSQWKFLLIDTVSPGIDPGC
jgi:hypothetical protein